MVKKKSFSGTEIDPVKIEHTRDGNNRVVIPINDVLPEQKAISFPEKDNATDVRGFDFAPWYGKGIDEITYVLQRQIERLLETGDGDRSIATIVGYCRGGLNSFLDYLALLSKSHGIQIGVNDIDRSVIDGLLLHLNDGVAARSSQKKRYDSVKAVLKLLSARGVLTLQTSGDDATFPKSPFGRYSKSGKGQRPLSVPHRKAFTAAVKTAVMPLFREDSELTGELLAFALLIVALHAGRNTTPLLTMGTDCLRPHPKPGLQFLVVYKRRGHRTSKVPVRKSRTMEETPTIYPTVVRLINRVIELTAPLRSEVRDHLKGRLWIYRRQDRGSQEVTALTPSMLTYAISKLIKRYDLRDDDGKPLRMNVSRLRKTFINRIYDILEGDAIATAAAADNTPQVTGTHYLRPSDHAARNWRFMGLALTEELLTATLGATEKTPLGRCTDNKSGQFAPKKGNAVCMNFLDCVRCRNYVITADDLYRLFSFYFRLYSERAKMGQLKWEKDFRHIIRIIDRDIITVGLREKIFKKADVDVARERARIDPHPFWKNTNIFEETE